MLIAITGRIGSGKSEVTKILHEFTNNIINADEINAEILKDKKYIDLIKSEFPTVIFNNNQIDKKKLSDLIFSDDEARLKLNKISHPLIYTSMLKKAATMNGVVFLEIPVLVDANIINKIDEIWIVESDFKNSIERLFKTRNISKEKAQSIINVQNQQLLLLDPYKYKCEIIYNNGSIIMLRRKIIKLLIDKKLF